MLRENNPVEQRLREKVRKKTATVAIVGLGYVGLPLAVEFSKVGFTVLGIDVDRSKVKTLLRGHSYIEDVTAEAVHENVRKRIFKPTTRFELLKEADAVIICVPTPLNRVKEPDLSYILSATAQISKCLHRGQLVILESTTYPGTTDEVILPELRKSRFKVGHDFFLCFSPERIDPGNKKFPVPTIPKVVGGVTPACTRLGSLLYGEVFNRVIPVSSARTAEMTKLLENTFRIVNIGLVNELATVAGSLGVNIWEAIEAASTKPFGFMPFYPGPGVGGHCIGIDPIYLSWKAKIHGFNIRSIELAREINANMPRYVVERAQRELVQKQKKAINQASILIVGVSYKKDVGDTRESPAFEVVEYLHELGAKVAYHDPYVPKVDLPSIQLRSKALIESEIKRYDMVLILTDHSSVDYAMLLKASKLIFDVRNVMKRFSAKKVVKL